MNNIYESTPISQDIRLGKNVIIEDLCLIGILNKFSNDKLSIGENSYIRAGTYIYSGNLIGKNFQTGNKVNIRENNLIGNNVSIGTHTVVEHSIKIGNNVRIHSQVFIPEFSILEDNCWIGPNVVITNAKYPKHEEVKKSLKGARVMKNAKIGANVTLLPGVTINENSLVGAGSVVTKDIPKNVIAVGSPAKVIKDIDY